MTRVLLSAYQCGPGMGSVSQIGWEWYSRLSAHVPVTLFTHTRNRPALERAGAPLGNSQIEYIDTEWFAGPLYSVAKRIFPRSEHAVFLLSSLDFFPFDIAALRRARSLMKSGTKWDIVHLATPVSPSAVSRMHKLGLPTVVGPLNGGLSSPAAFPELMKLDSGWFYEFGRLPRKLDSIFGSSAQAARILVANETTLATVPEAHRSKARVMLENGVDLSLFEPAPWPAAPGADAPLRVLFVGRLIPVKGVNFLIEAVRRLKAEMNIEVTVAGDGPMRGDWERLASEQGVADRFRFLGSRTLGEIATLHRHSHVFCLPSVRESGGAVLLEAMASARPIIAVNHGGPAVVTDSGVGALLPADGPRPLVDALVEAFRSIQREPWVWAQRGVEGRRRAEAEYSWDARIRNAIAMYREVRGS